MWVSNLEIEKLIDEYGRIIFRFCLKITKNKVEAEDIYQQTFLKALELKEKISFDNNPKSYLISIAINIYKNEKRKIFRRKRIINEIEIDKENLEIKDSSESIEDAFIKKDTLKGVNKIISSLNSKIKIPLVMYYTLEMSIEEISETLKVPKGTVKSRLFKGRDKIRKELKGGLL